MGALSALRMEHEDFHFAQDLARNDAPAIAPLKAESPTRPVKKRRKQQAQPADITRFFPKKDKP